MEGRPRFIPPTPEEEKAELDKQLDERLEWIKNKTAQVQAKNNSTVTKKGSAPAQPVPIDYKKKASGEDNEKELIMKDGEWVYKEYESE